MHDSGRRRLCRTPVLVLWQGVCDCEGFTIDYLNPMATSVTHPYVRVICCHRSMNQPLCVCEPSVDQVATEQLHVNFYLTMPLILRYNVLTLNWYVELFVRISITDPTLKNSPFFPITTQIAVASQWPLNLKQGLSKNTLCHWTLSFTSRLTYEYDFHWLSRRALRVHPIRWG